MAKRNIYLEARMAQQRASLDRLRNKKAVEKEIVLVITGDDGPEEMTCLFRAIGSSDYDRMVTKYPPTTDQRKEGLSYDIDKFAPELLSRVCVDPAMTADEAREIWVSPDWNRGELMTMFMNAVEVCTRGLDLGPTSSASE